MFFQSDPIGILSDIAPTIIGEFGINAPDEISGIDLSGSLT
jgi:bisphosphoglycerate-independent phosphoglycerate mutase (AlkP superfamily)